MSSGSDNQTAPAPASQQGRSWYEQIALWGLANAFNTKQALENARVGKVTGVPVNPIPFGNITVTAPQQSTPSPAPSSGLLSNPLLASGVGAGLLAGGMGLAKWLLPAAVPAAAPIAPVVQQAAEEIPLIVDWELNNAGSDKPAGN